MPKSAVSSPASPSAGFSLDPVRAATALLGGLYVWYATAWGPAVTPDSTAYLEVADNLLAGRGLTLTGFDGRWTPLRHWPPLYPLLLAFAGRLGVQPTAAAAALSLFCWGVILYGIGGAAARWSGNRKAGWVASALAAHHPALIQLHASALTEPLFLMLGLAAFSRLASHGKHPTLLQRITLGGLLGLAMLTRYAGIAGAAAVGLMGLVWGRGPPARRWRDTLGLWGIAAVPMTLWLGLTGEEGPLPRQPGVHGPGAGKWLLGLKTLAGWGLPSQVPWPVALSGLGVVLWMGWPKADGSEIGSARSFAWKSMILFIGVYLGFLLISLGFMDASTSLDNRILSPVLVALIPLGVAAVYAPHRGAAWLQIGLRWAVTALIALNAARTFPWLRTAHAEGMGYNHRQWRESALLEPLCALPDEVTVYTNAPDLVRYRCRRPARGLPYEVDPLTLQPHPEREAGLEALAKALASDKAALVWFSGITWRWYLPTEEELPGLPEYRLETEQGRLYWRGFALRDPAARPGG